MPKIVDQKCFDGAEEKIVRLGLQSLIEEVRTLISGFRLLVEEQQDANGGATLRKQIDGPESE